MAADERRPRWVLFAVLAVVLLAGALLGAHAVASNAAARAAQPGSPVDREGYARLAARLEPWNPEYRRQARVLMLWADGQSALDTDDYNRAVEILGEAYRLDVGNAELLAVFKTAQAEQALDTNRKAHLQHGHEGPGGTLRPEDLER